MVFSTKGVETTGNLHAKIKNKKNKNQGTDLTPFTKINLKWVVNLNVKCETISLLEGNVGENLDNFEYGDDFLDIASKAQPMKEVIDKLNFIKIKNLCSAKENIKRMRR